jgi:AraC-like DNA-binding protein
MEGLVSTRKLLPILTYAEAVGIDRRTLASRIGLGEQTGDWFSQETWGRLWRELVDLSGDPDIGLKAADKLERGYYGAIDYAVRSCPNVEAAIQRAARYFRLANSEGAILIEQQGRWVSVERRIHGDEGLKLPRQAAEFALASMVRTFRLATKRPFELRAVELRHPAPRSTRVFRQVFGCEVRFGATRDAIIFDRKVLAIEMKEPDPHLEQLIEKHALAQLTALGARSSLLDRLREALRKSLPSGEPGLSLCAEKLAISARTLQRRLDAEGTSYREVLDELRRELAAAYLAQEVSVLEVAFLLGYNDVSAFHRAFKKWTGRTPGGRG